MTAREIEVDGLRPLAVVRPPTPEELASSLREAVAAGQSVVPVGGGRALGLGDPLRSFDLAIDTTGLDRVVDHSQADLTATVEAGITLERLASVLGESGQLIPLDPFGGPGHTVGGALAGGLSGPLRLRYGSPRDYLVGLRVALPDGRLVRSGGRVVKNVSGYDMQKLHLGALGSLGIIVEASFKLFPRPFTDRTVETRPHSLPELLEASARALSMPMPPVALEVLSAGAGGWRALARFAGTGGAVDRMVGELGWPEGDPDFWRLHSEHTDPVWARVTVPVRRLPGLLQALPEGANWAASPGVGSVQWLGEGDPAVIRRIRGLAESEGGALVLMAAPVELKREVGVWGSEPAAAALMGAVRRTFDPSGLMSPGRYVV